MTIGFIGQDVRHATRTLAAHRGFTLAAAGMLALGIGIATAMFTIVDSLILRPVPFRDPDQLAYLWMGDDHGGRTLVAPAVVRAWRESPAFAGAESAVPETALLETGETVVTRDMATVTPGLFDLLGGVRPVRGRLFDAGEGRAGQNDRLLVSESVWRTLYGADPGLVGRTVTVNGERLVVVGILPADFRFPSAHTVLWKPTDLASRPQELARAYVRFAAGMPRQEALRFATEAARAADPATASLRPWVYTLAGSKDEYSRRAVPILAGGVGLVFLVLCANVCGLLLARVTARRREFSMRAALGASRARLIRQALVESGLLGTIGVLLGAALAWALVSIARALLPEPILLQTLNPLDLDARALAATSVAGLIATLASGLLPAWLGTRVDAGDSLRVVDRGDRGAWGARAHARAARGGSRLRVHAAGRRRAAHAHVREARARRPRARDLRRDHAVAVARHCDRQRSGGEAGADADARGDPSATARRAPRGMVVWRAPARRADLGRRVDLRSAGCSVAYARPRAVCREP